MRDNLIDISDSFIRSIIERQGTDVLFECFAALLVRGGKLDVDHIHVIPHENHKRNYKNDIIPAPFEEAEKRGDYFSKNSFEGITMYTSRSAILDYLPEDIYTEPDNSDEYWDETGQARDIKGIEAYREKVKEERKSAYRFFRPLEIEYNKARIQKQLHEVDQLEDFDEILEAFWGDFAIRDQRWARFIRTLHLAPNIVGDKEKTKTLIEYVLGTRVSLNFWVEDACEIPREAFDALTGGENKLGFNVSIGNTVYDYLEVCTLRIENLAAESFYRYFDEQSYDRQLLNEIINHYFPLHLDVRLDFSMKTAKVKYGEEKPIPVLGYSSKLG
jgi:hypothetical protein